jgi:hypothetical protein
MVERGVLEEGKFAGAIRIPRGAIRIPREEVEHIERQTAP